MTNQTHTLAYKAGARLARSSMYGLRESRAFLTNGWTPREQRAAINGFQTERRLIRDYGLMRRLGKPLGISPNAKA